MKLKNKKIKMSSYRSAIPSKLKLEAAKKAVFGLMLPVLRLADLEPLDKSIISSAKSKLFVLELVLVFLPSSTAKGRANNRKK